MTPQVDDMQAAKSLAMKATVRVHRKMGHYLLPHDYFITVQSFIHQSPNSYPWWDHQGHFMLGISDPMGPQCKYIISFLSAKLLTWQLRQPNVRAVSSILSQIYFNNCAKSFLRANI